MDAPSSSSTSLSHLPIKLECPRCDESVLLLHVSFHGRNSGTLRIMLRKTMVLQRFMEVTPVCVAVSPTCSRTPPTTIAAASVQNMTLSSPIVDASHRQLHLLLQLTLMFAYDACDGCFYR
ncbi:uncharacterized protein [Miscanthus floridulus]|uniref:uncharacterized protein n=1 Tax=Miscanthus floridulus TaxID=154761 RepID=UPI003458CFB1